MQIFLYIAGYPAFVLSICNFACQHVNDFGSLARQVVPTDVDCLGSLKDCETSTVASLQD